MFKKSAEERSHVWKRAVEAEGQPYITLVGRALKNCDAHLLNPLVLVVDDGNR